MGNRENERGAVIVITAFLMVGLITSMALVVDVGRLYLTRTKLQTAADAAALAGAYTYFADESEPDAVSKAQDYAGDNMEEDFNFSYSIVGNQFTVDLNRDVDFFFAPVIGIESSNVAVTATASAGTVSAIDKVVPFGVLKQSFSYGQQYVLKYGAGGSGCYHGNFGAVALGGRGACVYRNNIKYGYNGEIRVGDQIYTEPGNMAGPTDQGVSYRKSLCTHGCSFSSQIEANCPRVVVVPVIDSLPNGRKKVNVLGFAAFFLEATQNGTKGQKDVVGRFLKWAAAGESGAGESFGLTTVNLIH